ncbi:MAG: biopolymer transporter ExbD [Planctomycetota bacterium]
MATPGMVKVMRRARRSQPVATVELMPLIDVVFLLLTFFIFALVLTAPVKITEISLPETSAGGDRPPGALTIVGLTEGGQITLDENPVTADQLAQQLTQRLAEDPEIRVVVAPDERSTVGDQFKVIDALTQVGVTDVQFLRRPSDSSE